MPRTDVQERSVCAGLTTCGSGSQGGEGTRDGKKKGSRFETKRKGFQKGLRMCGRPGGLMIFDLGGEKGTRVGQGIRGGQQKEKAREKEVGLVLPTIHWCWLGSWGSGWGLAGGAYGKTLGVDVEGQAQQGGVWAMARAALAGGGVEGTVLSQGNIRLCAPATPADRGGNHPWLGHH